MDEILDVTLLVAEALDDLDVRYVVGGSLASSFHGIPRATIDADIVAALRDMHHAGFVEALRDAFYLDPDTIRRSIERQASFNVIHLATSTASSLGHSRSWNGTSPARTRPCANLAGSSPPPPDAREPASIPSPETEERTTC